MKRVLLVLMSCAAGAADLVAPAQQALLGREPYVTMAEQGLPPLPSVAEVDALMPWVRAQRAAAMKQVLFMRAAWTRAQGRRVSTQTESDCAGLARREEAPEQLTEMYQAAADEPESAAHAYARRCAAEELASIYSVDALAPHWLVEDLRLTPEEAESLLSFLPWEEMANRVSKDPPSEEMITADLRTMRDCYRAFETAYAGVDSPAAAEKAAVELLPVARLLSTTTPTRLFLMSPPEHLSDAQKALLTELGASRRGYAEQCQRLSERGWFGSLRLRALDKLAAD